MCPAWWAAWPAFLPTPPLHGLIDRSSTQLSNPGGDTLASWRGGGGSRFGRRDRHFETGSSFGSLSKHLGTFCGKNFIRITLKNSRDYLIIKINGNKKKIDNHSGCAINGSKGEQMIRTCFSISEPDDLPLQVGVSGQQIVDPVPQDGRHRCTQSTS